MVEQLLVAAIAFGVGVVETLAVLLIGYSIGRVSKGLEPEVRRVLPDFRSDRFPETETDTLDDEYFEKAMLTPESGGHEFPSDDELAWLNRHNDEFETLREKEDKLRR